MINCLPVCRPGLKIAASRRSGIQRITRTGVLLMLLGALCWSMQFSAAYADDPSDKPRQGKISGRSVVAGVLSFAVWPGIGQAVNDNKGKKVATHAVLGLLPPYRVWSAYDALVDRKGGYLKGKI